MIFINSGALVLKKCVFFVFAAMFFVGNCSAKSLEPKVFVEKIVRESLAVVNSKDLSPEVKRNKLSESVNKYLDVEWLAEKVFADYKNLNEQDSKRVCKYLKSYLLKFYAGEGKLNAMMGAELLPITERDLDGDKVKAKFKKDADKPVEIVWVVKNEKVLFVEIEGISQLITLKSEMKAAIGDGSLMQFIEKAGF